MKWQVFFFLGSPCEGQISCLNEDGQPVDWFVMYKLPRYQQGKVGSGVDYMYLDPSLPSWQMSKHAVNTSEGALGRTLNQLYQRYESSSSAYMLYNDAPPVLVYKNNSGHSKGALLFDQFQGFWLTHSIPHFPPFPEMGFGYPSTGKLYGQGVQCMTYSYKEFQKISHQLMYINPYIYNCSVPSAYYTEMAQICAGKNESMVPRRKLEMLMSVKGETFLSFAKSHSYVDDIYAGWIAQTLQTNLLVETWQRKAHQLPSNCSLPYHALNIKKQKLQLRKKRKKEREALGDKAPPKEVPKTIENQRIYDETVVDPEDEEVAFDEGTDEFSAYFNKLINPKVLITTSDRPRGRTVRFCEQLSTVIPNAHVYYRRGLALKKIIPQCISRDFTYLMVINEDRKMPNGLVLCHLPDGPTAHFKVSSVRLRKEMKRKGKAPTDHHPEIILNNFTTRLGHSIGRMFAALFPQDPQFVGRQVATFHNQRDFIFFRFHRYIFKNEKKVGIQELGPRFTLKLRSLQKGTFDSKFGEYEWVHKVKAKQEKDLKAKSFAPPYSPYPELYLLPVEENFNSHCSRSLSSDTVLYNTDSQTCCPPRPIFAPGQTKEPTKFPLIKQGPQQYVLAQRLENESSSSSLEGREQDTLGCEDSVWTDAPKMCWNVQEEFAAKKHAEDTNCHGASSPESRTNAEKVSVLICWVFHRLC
ncbi:ribosome production factor 1 [Clarias magur]|uniref:Ribosome production factor 1 n=1 Tax=Clarias magur TaxID=1594786 RepID=A0A8J4XH93_CLAMG|nr:ribosome production factor 1 [Clarias magur]